MERTSKPIAVTPEQELLGEFYAVLRQAKFYLLHPNPTPRAREDTLVAVAQACADYEARLRGGMASTVTVATLGWRVPA